MTRQSWMLRVIQPLFKEGIMFCCKGSLESVDVNRMLVECEDGVCGRESELWEGRWWSGRECGCG